MILKFSQRDKLNKLKADCGIYKIKNLKTNQCYVGQSVCISTRFKQHKQQLTDRVHSNSKLLKDWHKYGSGAFQFTRIEKCDRTQLDKREDFWIAKLNAYYNVLWSNGTKIIRKGDRIVNYKERHLSGWFTNAIAFVSAVVAIVFVALFV